MMRMVRLETENFKEEMSDENFLGDNFFFLPSLNILFGIRWQRTALNFDDLRFYAQIDTQHTRLISWHKTLTNKLIFPSRRTFFSVIISKILRLSRWECSKRMKRTFFINESSLLGKKRDTKFVFYFLSSLQKQNQRKWN